MGRDAFYEWLARGAPGKTRRGFDLEALKTWRATHIAPAQNKQRGGDDEDSVRLLRAQADEREAKARIAARADLIAQGEYLPMAEVKDRDIARVAVVKRGLLTLPRSAAPRLVGLKEKEMVAVLTKLVRELLERFARM